MSRDAGNDAGNGLVPPPVIVRMFSVLRAEREARGLPGIAEVDVAAEGANARDIAVHLGLSPDTIEGVFVNHKLYALDRHVLPGDRIAFVPYGTPGPHRFYLGLYKAGQAAREAEVPNSVDEPGTPNETDQ